ncbi:hypothetical protein C8Q73DRAFT_790647 [Cubamyces lactineus]|nr:hypothetical protein C8Q73DRAFT_790647 [Cubamyces lactineus]
MPNPTVKDPFDASRFEFEDTSASASRRVVHFTPEGSILQEDPNDNHFTDRPTIGNTGPWRLRWSWLTILIVALSCICVPIAASMIKSLSEIEHRCTSSAYVQQAIRMALESTVQPHDFALASGGARIVPDLTSPSALTTSPSNNPDNVLTGDLHDNACWLFHGSRGQVGIRLPDYLISPTHFALDFTLHSLLYSRAPRRIVLWGIVDGDANTWIYDTQLEHYRNTVGHLGDGPARSQGYTFLALSESKYDGLAPFSLQTFRIADAVVESRMTFGVLVLEVRSNWGGAYTGICRIRVHGTTRAAQGVPDWSSKPAAEEVSSSDDVFQTPPGSPPPPDEGDEDKSSTIRGSSGRNTPDTKSAKVNQPKSTPPPPRRSRRILKQSPQLQSPQIAPPKATKNSKKRSGPSTSMGKATEPAPDVQEQVEAALLKMQQRIVQGAFPHYGNAGQVLSPYGSPAGMPSVSAQFPQYPMPYPVPYPPFQMPPLMQFPNMQYYPPSTPDNAALSAKALGKQPARQPLRSSKQAKRTSEALIDEDDPMAPARDSGDEDTDSDMDEGKSTTESERDMDMDRADQSDGDGSRDEDSGHEGGVNREDADEEEDGEKDRDEDVDEEGADEEDDAMVLFQLKTEEVEEELESAKATARGRKSKLSRASKKDGASDGEGVQDDEEGEQEHEGKQEAKASNTGRHTDGEEEEASVSRTLVPRKGRQAAPSEQSQQPESSSSSKRPTIRQDQQRQTTDVQPGMSHDFALTILDKVQVLAESIADRDEQHREYQQRMIGNVKKLSKTVAEIQRKAPIIARRQVKSAPARRQREPQGMLSRIVMDERSSSMSLEEKAALAEKEKAHLIKLQKVVRTHAAQLFGFKGKDYATMVQRNPPLTDAEIAKYERDTSSNYFTKNPFRFDFSRSPITFSFNVEARDHFIRHLQRSFQGGSYKKAAVPERYITDDHIGAAFDTYMETCREHYRRTVKPLSEEEAQRRQQRARMNSRKNTLYVARESVLVSNDWTHHLDLFAKLDPEHMSGDETERDEQGRKVRPPAFIILDLPWASQEFRAFMRTLDDWYYDKRYNEAGQTGGNAPRTRKPRENDAEPPARPIKVKVPKGLHRNCYSKAYLRKLKPHELRALEIIDKDYDFTLPTLGAEAEQDEEGNESNEDGM